MNNLISFEFIEVDDCIREIYISNQKVFVYEDLSFLKICDASLNIYPKFLIKNYEYEFGTEIKFIFQDSIAKL